MSTVVGVGSPGAVGAASGGKIYGFANLSTAPTQVAPANPSRQSITFHNPGAIDVFIAPVQVLTQGGVPVTLNPTPSLLAGCFRVFANGGTLTIKGECQHAWQAFAASSTTPFTIMDSNLG